MKKRGFTLIELLISVTILVLVLGGTLSAFWLTTKLVQANKANLIANSLLKEKLEEIRNLPYEQIGIVDGYPTGTLPASETKTIENINFSLDYRVDYFDDPKDGLAPDDPCPNDYKLVKIEISWPGKFKGSVSADTISAPKNQAQECNEIGGVLEVEVFGASGENISFPLITVENLETGLTKTAEPEKGKHSFVLPEGIDVYKITVTKDGFSTDRTYGVGELYNGKTISTPINPHATVLKDQLTEKSFSIDKLSTFEIETLEAAITGNIYYVRKSGNDSQDGLSPKTAFYTISKAAQVAKAGDMVFVGAGSYQEEVLVENSGTQDNKIIFVADVSGSFTGDSGEVVIEGENYGFLINDKDYIEIYLFKIEKANLAGISIQGNSRYVKIIDNVISNNLGEGIFISGASNIEIFGNEIYSNAEEGIYLLNSNGSVVVKNIIYQNQGAGIKAESSGSLVIKFNESFLNGGEGILAQINSNNLEIKNNLSYLNGKDGILIYDHGSSLEVLLNKSYSNSGAGIAFVGNISNANKISSNLVYDNGGPGILVADDSNNNTIENNSSYKNQGEGILIENSTNIEIKNNIISENLLAGLKISTSTNISNSYNNLWQNSPDYQGIAPGEGSLSVDPLFLDPDGKDNLLGGDSGKDDSFYLAQVSAGQATTSACVDAGSDLAENLGMADKTTRSDKIEDEGVVDLGFHYSLEPEPEIPSPPNPFGSYIGDVSFTVVGTKIVGKDEQEEPIYKFLKDFQTGPQGTTTIDNLEWDLYNFYDFEANNISLDLILSWPSPLPIDLLPGTTTKVKLGLQAENTLRVFVLDKNSSEPIFSATVRLFNSDLNYDQTLLTDHKGQCYFIPLKKDNRYSLEVKAEGYEDFLETNIFISGHQEKTVQLIPIQ